MRLLGSCLEIVDEVKDYWSLLCLTSLSRFGVILLNTLFLLPPVVFSSIVCWSSSVLELTLTLILFKPNRVLDP